MADQAQQKDPQDAHEPTVLSSGRGSWATCSCGWTSPTFTYAERYHRGTASLVWADHLRRMSAHA